MILKPAGLRGPRHGERLGKAARLVELDVDGIVAAGKLRQIGARVGALVGANGNDALDAGQRIVVVRGQRLLDQLHARCRRRFEKRHELLRRPRLVGIGDQSRIGARRTHGGEALGIAGAAELQLQ